MGFCSLALFDVLQHDLRKWTAGYSYTDLLQHRGREQRRPESSAEEFAALALSDSIVKKFQDELAVDADAKAITKFLDCNSKCSEFGSIDTTNMDEITAIALGEAKKWFHDFWFDRDGAYWLNVDDVLSQIDIGPGASLGTSGNSLYEKLGASALSGTRKSLFALYNRAASRSSTWLETEKIRSSHYGTYVEVQGSRLTTVPKQHDISRIVCTEPLLNMLVQKGIASLLCRQLTKRTGISLEDQQPKNRALAGLGSRYGSYGTIDLSSASDTISLRLMREITPPHVLAWLMEARSPTVELPNGDVLPLHMISSMGNGFTFPLQTILFSSIVVGVYRALGIRLDRPSRDTGMKPGVAGISWFYKNWEPGAIGNFAVFGDDIIVRKEAYGLVCNLLGRYGFTVNVNKSFSDGPFRESCGADFWHGQNVRGVYCETLKTKQDVYSLINRLNSWSANHQIPLPLTCEYLVKVGHVAFVPVPPWESDVSGVKVPWKLARPFVKKRDSSRNPKKTNTGSVLYLRYVPKSRPISLIDVGLCFYVNRVGTVVIGTRPIEGLKPFKTGSGKWFNRHNPDAIVLAAVSGHLRDGSILPRQDAVFYQKRLSVSPCWDYWDPSESVLTAQGWQCYESTVWQNIGSCFAVLQTPYFTGDVEPQIRDVFILADVLSS